MRVTGIEELSGKSYKVYVDGEFAFALSKSELTRCKITDGMEINQELIDAVETEVVLKRAKKYVMHLLEQMDRTKEQLRDKLRSKNYKDSVIDGALAYVESFGYVDDKRLAMNFINSRKKTKSRKEIYQLLTGKKLPKELINEAFEEEYHEDDELEAIAYIAEKKRYSLDEKEYKEQQKIIAYFVRKGFNYEKVRQVLLR